MAGHQDEMNKIAGYHRCRIQYGHVVHGTVGRS